MAGVRLAPLDPDRFLAWAYWTADDATRTGSGPLTFSDVCWEFSRHGPVDLGDLRRSYVRLASRVRRNQRIGLDPWDGVR